MKGLIGAALTIFAVAANMVSATAAEGNAQEMARRFGVREQVLSASLSPDGNWLAIVQPVGGRGSSVLVADLRGGGKLDFKQITAADGNPQRIEGCRWSSAIRLLCTVHAVMPLSIGEYADVTRFVAIDRDGGNQTLLQTPRGFGNARNFALFGGQVIDQSTSEDGHVLMVRLYVPEESLGTRAAQTRDGLGVDDVDTETLKARIIEPAKKEASDYISDGRGNVRIMGIRRENGDGYASGTRNYFYRKKNDRSWLVLGDVSEEAGFEPRAIDPELDIVYGLKRTGGRLAAWSIALDGSGTQTQIFAHPSVDVDGFIRIGRNRRPVGVSYATDRREAYYFDPMLAKLARSLGKALSGKKIQFIDSSQDESKLLIWAGSDVEPGAYYLFDRPAGKLEILTLDRPELENVPLATVQAVTYKAADGTMIPGYLTLPAKGPQKGLPAIVLPHGGPAARDEWGFDWISQYLAGQGYAVLQPNFRGSAGYGDQWFQKNGFQNWRAAINDIDDGGRWLIKEGIAAPGRLAIMGWSYGGYAALQASATDPDLFRAAIAIAPVTDLGRLKEESRNWANFQIVSRYIGSGAHIDEGSPARQAGKIKVPVLMFHGTLDRNVGVAQSRLMEDRLKDAGGNVQLVTYDGLDHYLEDSVVRADMLQRIAAFLEANLTAK